MNITLTRKNRCWCQSARQSGIVGTNVHVADLHGLDVEGTVVTITGVRHEYVRWDHGQYTCWLLVDGWTQWPIHAPGDILTIPTTTEEASIWAALRAPIRREGTITLDDAAEIGHEVDARHAAAARLAPRLPGGSERIRRGLLPTPPDRPLTDRSAYTRGRLRHVPETGRWAADLGWAGTARPLGEHDTRTEAEAALRVAHGQAWDRLEEWLRTIVHGEWTLERLDVERLDVEDRMDITQAAALVGVTPSTWRGYVARRQAPAADGRTGAGYPWWHRRTVLDWHASRRGQEWRRTTP